MGRPRKPFGISTGGRNGNLLIVFHHRTTYAIRKIDAGTTSKTIAKRNAPSLIDAYYLRESEREQREEQDTDSQRETQSPPSSSSISSNISPEWRMSQLETYWWERMGGTIKPTTQRHIRSAFRNWMSLMGDTQINQISFSSVREWHTKFLIAHNDRMRLSDPDWNDAKTTNGIRNYHADLAAVWNVMLKSRVVRENPFQGQKPKQVELDPRGRAWSKEKEQVILNAVEQWAKNNADTSSFSEFMVPIVRLQTNTGLRPKEIVNLRNGDVKQDSAGKWWIQVRSSAAKSGKSRMIPVNDAALEAIEKMKFLSAERKAGYKNLESKAKQVAKKRTGVHLSGKKSLEVVARSGYDTVSSLYESTEYNDNDYIVGVDPNRRTRQDTIGKLFAKAVSAIKDIDADFYDCRHTFAVRMLDAGVPITKLAAIMGHSDIKLTQRYARTDALDVPNFD